MSILDSFEIGASETSNFENLTEVLKSVDVSTPDTGPPLGSFSVDHSTNQQPSNGTPTKEYLPQERTYMYGFYDGVKYYQNQVEMCSKSWTSMISTLKIFSGIRTVLLALIKLPKVSTLKIAEHLGVKKSTFYETIALRNIRILGYSLPKSGRPAKISTTIANAVIEFVNLNPKMAPRDIMKEFGIDCSTRTFSRFLRRYGFIRVFCNRKPAFTDRVKELRLKWAHMALPFIRKFGHKMVYLDETLIHLQSGISRELMYIQKGTKMKSLDQRFLQEMKMSKSITASFWGAISLSFKNCRSPGVVMTRDFGSQKFGYSSGTYILTLLKGLVSVMFPGLVFQQDNAPIHKSSETTAWFLGDFVQLVKETLVSKLYDEEFISYTSAHYSSTTSASASDEYCEGDTTLDIESEDEINSSQVSDICEGDNDILDETVNTTNNDTFCSNTLVTEDNAETDECEQIKTLEKSEQTTQIEVEEVWDTFMSDGGDIYDDDEECFDDILTMIEHGPKHSVIKKRISEIPKDEINQTNGNEEANENDGSEPASKKQKLADGSSSENNDYEKELKFVNQFVQLDAYNFSYFDIKHRPAGDYLDLVMAIYDRETALNGAPVDCWHAAADLEVQTLSTMQAEAAGIHKSNDESGANSENYDELVKFAEKLAEFGEQIKKWEINNLNNCVLVEKCLLRKKS